MGITKSVVSVSNGIFSEVLEDAINTGEWRLTSVRCSIDPRGSPYKLVDGLSSPSQALGEVLYRS